MKKELILLFIGILLIGLVTPYEGHELNTDLSFSYTSNNGTQCNITTANTPYGKIDIYQESTRTGQTFDSEILAGNFSENGDYCFNILCTDGAGYEDGSKCYSVSPSGINGTLGFYILILVLSLGVIIIGYYAQDAVVVLLGSFGLVFIGLYILFYGIDGIKDTVYTWAIGLITLCLAIYFGVRSSLEFLN